VVPRRSLRAVYAVHPAGVPGSAAIRRRGRSTDVDATILGSIEEQGIGSGQALRADVGHGSVPPSTASGRGGLVDGHAVASASGDRHAAVSRECAPRPRHATLRPSHVDSMVMRCVDVVCMMRVVVRANARTWSVGVCEPPWVRFRRRGARAT
jgi:hypothetical protein